MWYEIFKFEINYRAKRADTYIYFAILFLFSIVGVDFLMEGELGSVKRNAPVVIAKVMGIVSALFTMVTSMIMGVAVLRDFDHNIAPLMFVNPISKTDYLLGRFAGAFFVLVLVFSALPLGLVVGEFMPWLEPDSLLPLSIWHYLQPFICLVVPTLFFTGALFFVSGALSRKLIVVYTQGIFLLMIYILAIQLVRGTDNLFVAAMLDPFSFQASGIFTQFWTTAESNSRMLPIAGVLLYNRLLWVAAGGVVLLLGYVAFSFKTYRNNALKKPVALQLYSIVEEDSNTFIPTARPQTGMKTSIRQLVQHTLFYFRSILREVPFWAIVTCGMAIIFVNSIGLGTVHGVDSFPFTYIVVEELQEMSVFFFLMILMFYSGELIWKERDTQLNGIHDALPLADFINLAGKFFGLLLIYVVLILAMILAGVIFQSANGFYDYEWAVYFTHFFVGGFPSFALFTVVAFFFQILANHKFIGHILVVLFFFFTSIVLRQVFHINHGLLLFDGGDFPIYSAMNGYGHFLQAFLWFKLYWGAFAGLLFLIGTIFSIRGLETGFKQRWQQSKLRLSKPLLQFGAAALLVFSSSGCYIFYNTNVLNHYSSFTEEELYRVAYEQTLKQYEYMPQPKIVDVNLKVELYPYDRNYTIEGYFVLANKTGESIEKIHVQTMPNEQVVLEFLQLEGGAMLDSTQLQFRHYIYTLNNALLPGDSLKMEFKQSFKTQGFTENTTTNIVYNGSFFDNFHLPTLGYNEEIELEEDERRILQGLKPKPRRAKIDDPRALHEGRAGDDGEEINFEMIIGTDCSQIALAPGYLQREWVADNRNYFHYKMDQPMSNFYSIVSADYEIEKDQWIPPHDSLGSPVDLEIYYHQGHNYNLDRMMKAMKASFDYYSNQFGPYPYRQLRIMEFPRYANKAQSFPNTVPFSEGIGFIMNINDETDVDMAFFVTAHEVAHQWWGHQVNPANVQGMSMLSESLAQYAALMVLKEVYPENKVEAIVRSQRYKYLRGRTKERSRELPLCLVESGQPYIHYNKGLLNFYAFQDYISEDSLNQALKRFVRDWSSFGGLLKTDRYPTSYDLLTYFRAVTPDSLQYVIEDLFESITIYENRTVTAEYEPTSTGQYKVHLTLDALKFHTDSVGIETAIGVNDWIDVGIYTSGIDGEEQLIYLEKHHFTSQTTQLDIWVNEKPVKAGIDPLNKLIDRNASDNLLELSER